MRSTLDEQTFQRVTQVIDRARRSGASVPVRLNDALLLWTPERERNIRVDALKDLQMEFLVWHPHEFLRTVNRSLVNCAPTDMYIAIREWLDKYITHVRETS
jgi:hypothetical protein